VHECLDNARFVVISSNITTRKKGEYVKFRKKWGILSKTLAFKEIIGYTVYICGLKWMKVERR